MKRTTTQFLAIVASVSCPILAGADEYKLRILEGRLAALEHRLSEIEVGKGKGAAKGPKLPEAPAANSQFVYEQPAKALKTEFAVPKKETYVIRDGDTLGGIARKLNIPREALLSANSLEDGQPIYIGESLVIPGSPKSGKASAAVEGLVHTVKHGENLSGIAQRYRVGINELKATNRLHNDSIGLGQRLVIPSESQIRQESPSLVYDSRTNTNVELPSSTEPTSGKYRYENPLLNSNETYGYYQVQNGDNLYALARDFFTTPAELQKLNKMGGTTIIHTGQEVVVPTSKYNEYHNNSVGR